MTGLRRRAFPFLVFGVLSAGAIAAALFLGNDVPDQARLAARWTARAALPLFLLAYVARPAAQLWPNDLTRAILARRRQWGLAFAAAHTVHFAALTIALIIAGTWPSVVTMVGGGLAYVLIWAGAATSNTPSIKAMGRGWLWLHRAMMHTVWLIFVQSYAGRIAVGETMVQGLFFTALLLCAAAVRFMAWQQNRNRVLNPVG